MRVKLANVKPVRESAVEAELRSRVLARGGMCEKIMVIGQRGFPDRLVILPGPRVIFVELKRPRGGRLSPHQREYIAWLEALGVAVAVVRNSADIDRLLS
jgi:hypothetical protein